MVLKDNIARPSALVAAIVLVAASLVPLLSIKKAGAYGLLGSREIKISSSVGAATDVTYSVSAVTPSTQNIGSIAIEFCSNSPIIGDSCTTPGGFDINEAGLALANQAGITDWTIDASTDTNTLVLNRTGGSASFTAGTFSLELGAGGGSDGVTNPTAVNTSYYGRILTFTDIDDDGNGCTTTDDWAGCYVTAANSDQSQHAGGTALSTAEQITVTSKVQERLVFCVYTTGAGNDCSGKSGSAVTLGDANGVLDPAGPYVDKNAKFSITTNASGNAIIRAKGSTLTTGSYTVDPIGSGTAQAASTPGSEQFGFCAYQSAGSGMTIDADYDGDDGAGAADDCSTTTQTAGTGSTGGVGANSDSQFAFITAELTATYGSTVATKPAGSYSTGTFAFVGNISNITEAGIYTSVMTFIATGTY